MTVVMNPTLLECLLSTQQSAGQPSAGLDHQDRNAGTGAVVEISQVVGQVGDLVGGLPRLLMAISAELAAWQQAGGFGPASSEELSDAGHGATVGMARLALAEATTAARILAHCVNDTGRMLTTIAPAAAGTGVGAVVDVNRSKVSV